jgi:hypothetical protein
MSCKIYKGEEKKNTSQNYGSFAAFSSCASGGKPRSIISSNSASLSVVDLCKFVDCLLGRDNGNTRCSVVVSCIPLIKLNIDKLVCTLHNRGGLSIGSNHSYSRRLVRF